LDQTRPAATLATESSFTIIHGADEGDSQGMRTIQTFSPALKTAHPLQPIGLSNLHVKTIHYLSGIKEMFSSLLVETFDMLSEGITHEKQERFTEGACEVHAATSWLDRSESGSRRSSLPR